MNETRPPAIDQRLIRALAHPLRVQILEILSERVASPVWLAEELNTGLTDVAYHTRALDKCGCLRLVDTGRTRGAIEHFYTALPTAFIGSPAWRRVPRSVRGAISAATLQTFLDKAEAALEAGTIDNRDDTTLSWMPVHLDALAWGEVRTIMRGAIEQVLAAQERSNRRLARAGSKGSAISAVVGMAQFETAGSRQD